MIESLQTAAATEDTPKLSRNVGIDKERITRMSNTEKTKRFAKRWKMFLFLIKKNKLLTLSISIANG